MTSRRKSGVYVVHEEDDDTICKVGVSCDCRSRFKSLQSATWRKLVMPYVCELEGGLAYEVEEIVCAQFAKVRIRGEWLRMPSSKLIAAIEHAALGLPVELSVDPAIIEYFQCFPRNLSAVPEPVMYNKTQQLCDLAQSMREEGRLVSAEIYQQAADTGMRMRRQPLEINRT